MRPRTVQDSWCEGPEQDGDWSVSSSCCDCPGSPRYTAGDGMCAGPPVRKGASRICATLLTVFGILPWDHWEVIFRAAHIENEIPIGRKSGSHLWISWGLMWNLFSWDLFVIFERDRSGFRDSLFILSHIMYIIVWAGWESGEIGSFCLLLIRYSVSFCFGSWMLCGNDPWAQMGLACGAVFEHKFYFSPESLKGGKAIGTLFFEDLWRGFHLWVGEGWVICKVELAQGRLCGKSLN